MPSLLSPVRHGKNIDSDLLQSVYFEGETSAESIMNLFGKCNKCYDCSKSCTCNQHILQCTEYCA